MYSLNEVFVDAGGVPTVFMGEIVAWELRNVSVRHADLVAALSDAGLESKEARKFIPQHAIRRALHKLSESRVVAKLSENSGSISFQFTKESVDDGLRLGSTPDEKRLRYDFEAVLTLDKTTGRVECKDEGLAAIAQSRLDEAMDARTTADVTAIVQRLFKKNADLFPVRNAGGCYFCPEAHRSFLEKIETFLARLNGKMSRFPVPRGTVHGNRSVQDAVAMGIDDAIDAHRKAIDGFTEDTRAKTLERRAEQINATRFKAEAYSDLLAEEKERLDRMLAGLSETLKAKIDAIGAEEAVAA